MAKKTRLKKIRADIRKKLLKQETLSPSKNKLPKEKINSYEAQLSTITKHDLIKTMGITIVLFGLEYAAFLAVKHNYFGLFQ